MPPKVSKKPSPYIRGRKVASKSQPALAPSSPELVDNVDREDPVEVLTAEEVTMAVEEKKIVTEVIEEKRVEFVCSDESEIEEDPEEGPEIDEEEVEMVEEGLEMKVEEEAGFDEDLEMYEEEPEEEIEAETIDNGYGVVHGIGEESIGAAGNGETVGAENGDYLSYANDERNKDGEGDGVKDNIKDAATYRKKRKGYEIFIGGLDKEAVESDLTEVFGKYGEIQSLRIVKYAASQKSKGFAFIRYATVEQAEKVLAELKDGIEVRGKRVGLSKSQDTNTLYMSNICKTWTKEQVLETLKACGVQNVEDICLPEDAKKEGTIKGYAFLEFSTHSDAMEALQRLKKPDAVFGCDRSAKVAFAQSSVHCSEEALSQVKSVFLDGLPDSWDKDKLKEVCKPYGEIEKVQLSRDLASTKRKDYGFVLFTSQESARACVDGINNSPIGVGDVKIKADLAKREIRSFSGKKAVPAQGGHTVRGHPKSKRGTHLKPQGSIGFRQGSTPIWLNKEDRGRKEQPARGGKRGGRSMDTVYRGQPSKRPRGNMHGRPTSGNGNLRNNTRLGNSRESYVMASGRYVDPYAQRYAGHAYGAQSGSKRQYSELEPHVGYHDYATSREQVGGRYEHVPRRVIAYDNQEGSHHVYPAAGLGGQPSNAPVYQSYTGYENGRRITGYGLPSSKAYPPRPTYY